ncbi:MAG: hypothetical protein Q7S52_02500 [bacterium]|nr:hypothetical protein [bacterium]
MAIVFAVVCGTLILAPQIIFILNEGDHYKGYYMMKTEAEWFYLARMNEFHDEGRIGNPFLLEHKYYGPQFMQSGAETILAIPGKLLDISVPTLNLMYKFLLPALTFLLLYALIFRLTASSPWSIAGGLMFLVGSTWLYANNLSHFLRGDSSFFTEFVYNRPVHPQFDGVLFFLYLNVLLTIFERSSSRDIQGPRNTRPDTGVQGGSPRSNLKNNSPRFDLGLPGLTLYSCGLVSYVWYIVLAALLGLSFYTYFYSFTFFLALNFVVFLLWLYFGKKKEALSLAFATIGGVLIGIPQLLAIYAAYHHPDYPFLAAVQPVDYGHAPEISKNGLLVSLLFVIYLFRTQALRAIGFVRERAIFFLGLLVTTFVVVNQQVLTGISLHSGHYHHNFNIPIFIIVLMFLASVVASRVLRSENTRSDVDVQGGSTRSNLKNNSPRFDLVLPGLTLYFPDFVFRALPWILSAVFIATGATIQYFSYQYHAPETSREQRYMPALSWLKENTPNGSVVMANETLSRIIPIFTGNNVMSGNPGAAYLVPLERRLFTPENLLLSNDFLHDIKQYRVDYILWDQKADPNWSISHFNFISLYSDDGLVIYQLSQ